MSSFYSKNIAIPLPWLYYLVDFDDSWALFEINSGSLQLASPLITHIALHRKCNDIDMME